jgi:hypothetical protein
LRGAIKKKGRLRSLQRKAGPDFQYLVRMERPTTDS